MGLGVLTVVPLLSPLPRSMPQLAVKDRVASLNPHLSLMGHAQGCFSSESHKIKTREQGYKCTLTLSCVLVALHWVFWSLMSVISTDATVAVFAKHHMPYLMCLHAALSSSISARSLMFCQGVFFFRMFAFVETFKCRKM